MKLYYIFLTGDEWFELLYCIMLKYFLFRLPNTLYRVHYIKTRKFGLLTRLHPHKGYHVAMAWGRSYLNFQTYKYIPLANNFLANILTCQVYGQFKTVITNSSKIKKDLTENAHAHAVLESNPVYRATLAPKGCSVETEEISDDEFQNMTRKDWNSESAESVFSGFKKMLVFSSKKQHLVDEETFDGVIKALTHKCSQLNDNDLIGILACLREWPPAEKPYSKHYVELWNVVDKQCLLRMEKWDRNKLLFVADHWYLLNLGKISEFMWHCTVRLSRRPEKLTSSQLVQCMFYINVRRKFPPHISVYDFEYSLQNCLDQLTLDELGILAMGFFKSEKPIRSQTLLTELMRRIINSVDTIHEITLAALLKVIRYSLEPTHAEILFILMDKLVPNINRVSRLCCTHIALLGTNIHLYHEGTMNEIVKRFVDEIESSRLKDLERLAFALSLYNYEHKMEPSIYKLIAKELCRSERAQEIQQHPKCLSCCLHYLSLQKIYLNEEISKVLDESFIRAVYGKNNHKVGREILSLDMSVGLECPEYKGNRLEPKLRNYLAKIYTDSIWEYKDLTGKKLSATDQILLEVISAAISVLGGREKVHLGHLIPHRERADIVYGICAGGSAVDIPPSFCNLEIGTCKRPPDVPNTKWYCIVVGGWNSYIRILNKPVGSMSSKLRHLQLLGYKPVVVPWFEWKQLSIEEQERYLAKKIWEEFKEEVSCTVR